MSATSVVVIAGHEALESTSIVIVPGDQVVVGERGPDDDGTWPAFVPVTTASGATGWVPERYLDGVRPAATVLRGYDTQELPAVAGERLTLIEDDAESGWSWCRNAVRREGWIPNNVLA